MRAFFYQFELHDAVRNNFTVRINGKLYRFCRLPMGANFAPTIAQVALLFLLDSANVDLLLSDAYVDNILVVADDENALLAFMVRFENLCAHFGVTLGKTDRPTSTPTHRGITFDLAHQRFRLSNSFISKFEVNLEQPSNTHWLCSSKRTEKLMGSIIYACTALSWPLSSLFSLIRVLSAYALRTNPHISPKTKTTADRITSLIVKNKWQTLSFANDVQFTLFTDASTSENMVAAVLVTPQGRLFIHTETTDPLTHINVMEAQAIYTGVSHFAQRIKHARLCIVSDNTAVLYALAATHSRSFHLNTVVERILRLIRSLGIAFSLFYVDTSRNPADGLSRATVFTQLDRATALTIDSALRVPQQVVEAVSPIAGTDARPIFLTTTEKDKHTN
jgi:hypothetical protein